MKKLLILLLLCLFLFACSEDKEIINENNNNQNNQEEENNQGEETNSPVIDNDEKSDINKETEDNKSPVVPTVDLTSYFDSSYIDLNSNLEAGDISEAKVFYDGSYINEILELSYRKDIKYEFYTDDNMRFVNSSDGYAITIPSKNVVADYSISSYRNQLVFDDCILTLTYEQSNPYGDTLGSWLTYSTEWLNRYIANDLYLEQNNLEYSSETLISNELLNEYEIMRYAIYIDDSSLIEKPYYNIGIVRKIDSYAKFYLFVMKSETDKTIEFDEMLSTFKQVEAYGRTKNHVGQYELKANPNWNNETKAYFEKLNDQSTFEFGFFTYSLDDENYDLISERLTKENKRLFELTDYHQAILPTYNHLYWGETKMNFPLQLANTYAGGNGFDDKAVLQFTLQYTNNNNNVSVYNKTENYTPMFDIMRGKYDTQFRELARDIKAYGKPVLFRLNNEMNTDWTSYCGMMSLIDPDIFRYTWIRLYEIFEEEGVDNCIWIFNPIAITCPYSSWGEDLCYMPGVDYVQALGITRYEMMNDDVQTLSFKEGYTLLYNKNKDHWMNYPWIVSEFGCASGGELSGELFRNHLEQAKWVEGMFECLLNKDKNKFCSKITAAVWFNCNDIVDGKVMNALYLDSSLSETFKALKEGLSHFD